MSIGTFVINIPASLLVVRFAWAAWVLSFIPEPVAGPAITQRRATVKSEVG